MGHLDVARMPWGKYDNATGDTHRLEHHSADVACCFRALVAEPVLRDRFARASGSSELDEVTLERLVVLAFLHDAGKLATGFQFKVGDRRPDTPQRAGHLMAFFQAWQRLKVIDAWGLGELLDWGPGVSDLLHAALAHHGRPVGRSAQDNPGPESNWHPFADYDPILAGQQLVRQARVWFPLAFEEGTKFPHPGSSLAHLFAGTLAIADQVGSNEELFRRVAEFDPNYIDRARDRAKNAVQALGFTRARWAARTPDPDFGDLFDGWKPHPMQTAVAEAPLDSPLLILESETGSGKTEAAIWRFAKLWHAGLVDGLYFALPTRAAARQLHGRADRALKRVFPAESRLGTVLAVPGYIRFGDATGRNAAAWKVEWHDDPLDVDRRARWSAESARKFLTATAAVGTVDQVLLSGLQVKWAHMRGSAMARSLLVADEVHASDAYMTEILKAVLNDHLAVGGHALLMSATLGSDARDSLLVNRKPRRKGHRTSLTEAVAAPYPLLTFAHPRRAPEFTSTGYTRDVAMSTQSALTDAARIGDLAVEHAQAGAKVLVIRNTVASACSVFDHVRDAGQGDLLLTVADGPALHHSRFAAEDRRLLDDAVEKELGKGREAGGCIVIGTQTLEQSLDIDADILATDLCPVDVLLQRIGRVHRHAGGSRPDGYDQPRCIVLVPGGGRLSEPLLRHGLGMSRTGGIYRDLRMLEATRQLIERHPTWTIPGMNRRLVEEGTHQERLQVIEAEMDGALFEEVDGRTAAERVQARNVVLDRKTPFCELTFVGDDMKVRTRLGEDGPRIRLAEAVVGPFGHPVSTFSPAAHLFRNGMPTPAEIGSAWAEVSSRDLVLAVGTHRFRYTRSGLANERS